MKLHLLYSHKGCHHLSCRIFYPLLYFYIPLLHTEKSTYEYKSLWIETSKVKNRASGCLFMTWTKIPPPAHHKTNNNYRRFSLDKITALYLPSFSFVVLFIQFCFTIYYCMHILRFTNQLFISCLQLYWKSWMHLVSEPREPSISV